MPPSESTAYFHSVEVSQADRAAIEWFDKEFQYKGLDAIYRTWTELQSNWPEKDLSLHVAKRQRVRLELRRRELRGCYDLARVARDFFALQEHAQIVPFKWTNLGTFGGMRSAAELLYCRHMNCFQFVQWCGWLAGGQPSTYIGPVEDVDETGKSKLFKGEWIPTPKFHGDLANNVWGGGGTKGPRKPASVKPARNKVIILSRPGNNRNTGHYNHVGISDGLGMVYNLSGGDLGLLRYDSYSFFCSWGATEYEGDYEYCL